jgi:hypothetical protein
MRLTGVARGRVGGGEYPGLMKATALAESFGFSILSSLFMLHSSLHACVR